MNLAINLCDFFMNQSRLVKISKYLSYHLRHRPDKLGLELAPGGWVPIKQLLAASKKDRFPITYAELEEVVEQNDKQRFSFDATGKLVRANQGHSIEIDLQLETEVPPDILYHGTGHRAVESILREGLHKMKRHHVHLSADVETATKVGARHGNPVVFLVDAAAMQQDGYLFYCSENGVWLVDSIPPEYIEKM